MDFPKGRIRANHLDIEFDPAPLAKQEPQKLKLYNMATLPKKIQIGLLLVFFLRSRITNFTSIASFLQSFSILNLTCKCMPML